MDKHGIGSLLDESREFQCGITTDNGSNFVKAIKLWTLYHIRCFNHNLNLVLVAAIKSVKRKNKKFRKFFNQINKTIKYIKISKKMNKFSPTLKPSVVTRWETFAPLLQSLTANDNFATLKVVLAE